MALRGIQRVVTMMVQNLVSAVRLGQRPFSFTFQFLLSAVRPLFASSSSCTAAKLKSVHFSPGCKVMEFKGRILVYSILGCPHCMRAKNTLLELGLPYADVRLDVYPKQVREELKLRTGKSTVPQIFFNAYHIGGNEELQKLVGGTNMFTSHL